MATTAEIPAFDLSMKKKKKKKPTKVEEAAEELEALEVNDKDEAPKKDEDNEEGEEAPDSFDFGSKKKKPKKKPTKAATEEPSSTTDEPQEESATPSADGQKGLPWAGSDRDYTYEELAGRVYDLMHNNNPELGAKQKRYTMKPPQVCREGTKKTVWLNFAEICPILKRKPEHVLNYVLAELGTNGSVDGKHRLVIKGRFQPKQIENVVRHYISEYVACRTCKSPDTQLKKENRLYFLCCNACGSTRSVAPIKKGFEAQVGKRKKEEK